MLHLVAQVTGNLDGLKTIGRGLVIGLAGTGDSQQNELKKKFFQNLIRNMGTNVPLTNADLKSRNTRW